MKRLMMLLSLGLLSLPAIATCLSLGGQSLDLDDSQAGAAHVHWQVTLENGCDRAQDAMLTVQFVDAQGNTVYEVRDQRVVERMGRIRAGREVYVPANYVSQIEDMRILLEERERPF